MRHLPVSLNEKALSPVFSASVLLIKLHALRVSVPAPCEREKARVKAILRLAIVMTAITADDHHVRYFYTLPDFIMFANPLLYFVEPLSWHVFDQIQRIRNPVLQLEQYHQWIRRAVGLLPIARLDLRELLTQLFGLCTYLVRQKKNDEIKRDRDQLHNLLLHSDACESVARCALTFILLESLTLFIISTSAFTLFFFSCSSSMQRAMFCISSSVRSAFFLLDRNTQRLKRCYCVFGFLRLETIKKSIPWLGTRNLQLFLFILVVLEYLVFFLI